MNGKTRSNHRSPAEGTGWIREVRRGLDKALRLSLACSLLFLAGCLPGWTRGGSGEQSIPVKFSYYSPEVKKVCVAGSFNGWSTVADCMNRDGDRWTHRLSLPPGKYDYLLVLDDEKWVLDPGAAFIDDNGFGGANSILIVE